MKDERSIDQLMRSTGVRDEVIVQVGRLWGKSAARNGGRTHLLVGHLLDTAAVAGLLWDRFLAQSFRRRMDEVSGGCGRAWLMWVCGIHDCGKACPAFQAVDAVEAAPVLEAGLTWGRLPADRRRRWRHDVAGAAMLLPRMRGEWADAAASGWVWPLVAGHHGAFPPLGRLQPPHPEVQGRGAGWAQAQRVLVDVFTRAVGFEELAAVCPVGRLSKAEQLALSGLIVMADWIASDSQHFEGLPRAGDISPAGARRRAEGAWKRLGLRGGWGDLLLPSSPSAPLTQRLGVEPRASQRELVGWAWRLPAPGLLVVEAPMGEGKTKAALAAAEILAARFGADGVFVAMPTQATSDPMYGQVVEWVRSFDPELEAQVALLHGKRRFNRLWREIWESVGAGEAEAEVSAPWDVYGAIDEDDEFGLPAGPQAGAGGGERSGPPEWFLGAKRGLLSAFAVGTVDHLLYAATRTRHVMLRFAGLVGKVVIVDEVHAADVYMRQFLLEALRWLGQARVPVVMLSATLPPVQRQAFADAYLAGVMGAADVSVRVPEPAGYPCVTAAFAVEGQPRAESSQSVVASWRPSAPVRLGWLADVAKEGEGVAAAAREAVAQGGVVLVIVNQVDRAQAVYEALRRRGFEGELHLLHGRLCARDRAQRTERCLRLMGPGGERPERMVVVATQLAEQSFDVDADVLITDLAPVDLLLQRIGRLHRHEGTRRPAAHRVARVWVTGVAAADAGGRPRFLPASRAIYGEWMLLRAAALVAGTAGPLSRDGGLRGLGEAAGCWSVPADVPGLVARGYGEAEVCPPGWGEAAAREAWLAGETVRENNAQEFLLTRPREWGAATLEGLHYAGSRAHEEEDLDAVVRDGERSVEAVVVRRLAGGYAALDGTRLGVHGEVLDEQVVERLLGGTVRLPAHLAGEADRALASLPAWSAHPWLRYARALVLEADGWAAVGERRVTYDDLLGVVVERV
ncbi:CRISPR-associated helicase Cas3' [Streptomyces asoensis]|uniref:CRISPR-associated helicase Cas3' n=1 Tax=Streptomyces asoensis TaxID=249586 RepID=UPI0033FBF223